ncbi:MAG: hypothetical protein ACTSRA_19450, partial [Promethearchaeota archaeon]
MESKILRGELTDDELLAVRIRVMGKKPSYYEEMASGLDFKRVDEFTKVALRQKNLNAIRGLAGINRRAVALNLQSDEGIRLVQEQVKRGSDFGPEIFFMLRSALDPYYRQLFKNLTKLAVLKELRKIAGRGLRGIYKHRMQY